MTTTRHTDLTGEKFGRLTVVERVGRRKGFALWQCVCECGEMRMVRSDVLVGGSIGARSVLGALAAVGK